MELLQYEDFQIWQYIWPHSHAWYEHITKSSLTHYGPYYSLQDRHNTLRLHTYTTIWQHTVMFFCCQKETKNNHITLIYLPFVFVYVSTFMKNNLYDQYLITLWIQLGILALIYLNEKSINGLHVCRQKENNINGLSGRWRIRGVSRLAPSFSGSLTRTSTNASMGATGASSSWWSCMSSSCK